MCLSSYIVVCVLKDTRIVLCVLIRVLILICICLYRLVLGTLLSFAVGKMTATVFLAEMRYSVYLLYWYKSTNTDAEGAAEHRIHRYLRLESEAGKQKKNARVLLAK